MDDITAVATQLLGGAVSVTNLISANFAQILIGEQGGKPFVLKSLKSGDGYTAASVALLCRCYHDRLKALGVTVPERYETQVVDGVAYELSSFAGAPHDVAFAAPYSQEQFRLVVRALESILGVLSQPATPHMEVGLDLRHMNFVGDDMTWIDFHPPAFCHEGVYHCYVPMPPADKMPLELELKFTAYGMLRRFYNTLLLTQPAWHEWILLALSQVLPDSLGAVFERFNQLVSVRWPKLSAGERLAVVQGLSPADSYALREVGALLLTRDQLTELFAGLRAIRKQGKCGAVVDEFYASYREQFRVQILATEEVS